MMKKDEKKAIIVVPLDTHILYHNNHVQSYARDEGYPELRFLRCLLMQPAFDEIYSASCPGKGHGHIQNTEGKIKKDTKIQKYSV